MESTSNLFGFGDDQFPIRISINVEVIITPSDLNLFESAVLFENFYQKFSLENIETFTSASSILNGTHSNSDGAGPRKITSQQKVKLPKTS